MEFGLKPALEKLKQSRILIKQEMALTLVGSHANHLHLAPYIWPCQHLITQFFNRPDGPVRAPGQ